jgi:glucans biosynthesis protein C
MSHSQRFHALDAARAIALLLNVLLHSSLSFLPGWSIVDSSPGAPLGLLVYVIHMFALTTYFLMSGFFAHMLFHRAGLSGFIRNRLTRIAAPLALFWFIVIALIFIALLWASKQLNQPMSKGEFSMAQLWFLYVLLLIYIVFLPVRWVFVRIDPHCKLRLSIDQTIRKLLESYAMPLVAALPLAIVFCVEKSWVLLRGIPSPHDSLIPNVYALTAFGVAFCFGWLLHRQTNLLSNFQKQWRIHLSIAIALTITSLWLISPLQDTAIQTGSGVHLAFSVCYALATWYWTFALIGFTMQFLSEEKASWRYVADASYWIYLMHLPIVVLLQAWMMLWPIHWTIKFPLIIGITMLLLLTSYHWLVRYTFIGALLNGRKQKPTTPRPTIRTLAS